jgi:hypothetical protein
MSNAPEREEWKVSDKLGFYSPAMTSPKQARNVYSEPSSERWSVRGPAYLEDRVKQPSRPAAYSLVGINVFRTRTQLFNAAESVRPLHRFLQEHSNGQYFITTFVLPGPPFHTVVHLFKRTLPLGEDSTFDKLLQKFTNGGEEFQKDRYKFLCLIPDAPWGFKVAVSSLGGERPVIIGRKLETQHFTGSNYLEIDINVASSKVASMLNSLVLRASATLVVDMGFTIEGQEANELPERILANVRWHNCAIDEIAVTLDEQGEIASLDVSSPYIACLEGGSDCVEAADLDAIAEDGENTAR